MKIVIDKNKAFKVKQHEYYPGEIKKWPDGERWGYLFTPFEISRAGKRYDKLEEAGKLPKKPGFWERVLKVLNSNPGWLPTW